MWDSQKTHGIFSTCIFTAPANPHILLILKMKVSACSLGMQHLDCDSKQQFSGLSRNLFGGQLKLYGWFQEQPYVFLSPVCLRWPRLLISSLSAAPSLQTLQPISRAASTDKTPHQSFRGLKQVPVPNQCYGERKEHLLREDRHPPTPLL